jgi:hypothetical protein
MTLEQVGFQLQQRQHTAQERLFGNNEAVATQIQNIPEPDDPQKYLIYRNGRTTRRNLNRDIFVAQLSRWESSTLVDVEISYVTLVPSPGIGAVIDLVSKHGNEAKEYKVNIGHFPECSCIDVQQMVIKFKKRGQYYNCKHLYYVYCIVCGMQRDEDRFIHATSLSFNEIKRLLLNGIVDRILVP